jgi:hypothetical protein
MDADDNSGESDKRRLVGVSNPMGLPGQRACDGLCDAPLVRGSP